MKFNLIIPVDQEQRYINPSMLLPRNANVHHDKVFNSMEIVYNEIHNHKLGNTLLIGTFHKLVSGCSKVKGWKLCLAENHPSYTDAYFEMKEGMRLVLTLLKADSIRVSIWCSKNLMKQDISQIVTLSKRTRQIVSFRMTKLGIAHGDTFSIICPHSQSTDNYTCLVKVKEYQHPTPNTISYWYLEYKCFLHKQKLRENMVPSLLMLSSGT